MQRIAGRGGVLRLLALWLPALLAGCNFPGQPNPADRPVPENQVADFAALYQTHCAACHGADGQFGPSPPLNDPIFLAIVSDDTLFELVNRGRKGTPMPGFSQQHGGPLTDEQVRIVASGIKPRWGKQAGKQQETAKIPDDLPRYKFTPPADHAEAVEAVARGRQRFAQACGDCHGDRGQGDSAGAVNDPDFLALVSDQMLRRIIITGRPDWGMPNFAATDGRSDGFQPLSSAEIDDLVALLGHWRSQASDQPADAAAPGTGAQSAGRPLDRFSRRPNQ